MNLLQNRVNNNDRDGLTISEFRKFQYDMIPDFIDLIVNYVSKQNGGYLQVKNKMIRPKLTYQGIYNTELVQTDVFVNNTNINDMDVNEKLFFKLYIPKLIYDSFFMINGNFYVPTLYILDKPIVIKKKSIKLFSLYMCDLLGYYGFTIEKSTSL